MTRRLLLTLLASLGLLRQTRAATASAEASRIEPLRLSDTEWEKTTDSRAVRRAAPALKFAGAA